MLSRPRVFALLALAAAVVVAGRLYFRPVVAPPQAPTEVHRSEVDLKDRGLVRKSDPTGKLFTGAMVERYVDGKLRTRVEVVDGKVQGISRGWYENGQQEVEETFVAGVSHGIRTRWHANGKKKSETNIAEGQLEGPHAEWHENGQKAVSMNLAKGRGEGVADAWHPDGKPKSHSLLKAGEPVEQQFFDQ